VACVTLEAAYDTLKSLKYRFFSRCRPGGDAVGRGTTRSQIPPAGCKLDSESAD